MPTNKDYFEVADKYSAKFGDIFPRMQYHMSDTDAIAFMEKCIDTNKSAEELEPSKEGVLY